MDIYIYDNARGWIFASRESWLTKLIINNYYLQRDTVNEFDFLSNGSLQEIFNKEIISR